MINSTAKAEQFYTRSGSESTKPSRKGFSLLGGGEDPTSFLTAVEKRANFYAARQAIEKRIGALTSVLKGDKITHAERQEIAEKRKKLKEELAEISAQQQALITSLRGSKAKQPQDLSRLIVEVARERMTVPQFRLVIAEAKARFAAQEEGLPQEEIKELQA